MPLKRLEEIRISVSLDHFLSKKHEKLIQVFNPPPIAEGDKVTFNYRFMLEYYGQVVERFQSLRQLMADPGVVVGVSVDELKYGESLFIALIDEIRAVQENLRDRNDVR